MSYREFLRSGNLTFNYVVQYNNIKESSINTYKNKKQNFQEARARLMINAILSFYKFN